MSLSSELPSCYATLVVAVTPPPAPAAAEEDQAGDEEEPIDEDDPLWKATLKLTLGDRDKALKLLEDPDSLMQYPEIKKIMEEGGGDATEDWESANAPPQEVVAAKAPPAAPVAPIPVPAAAAPSPARKDGGMTPASTGETEDGDMDEEAGSNAPEVLVEGDPREHLNLVFIGHVDAGKSTLSGSILYLMGKVDARTIERFEREAKQRNRESWFLAFIMDTSEEERAKGKTVEVGRAHFETDVNRYTILDAPGHKNYVPNMIAGTYILLGNWLFV
jgi:peptide chain release factor subunit 3